MSIFCFRGRVVWRLLGCRLPRLLERRVSCAWETDSNYIISY